MGRAVAERLIKPRAPRAGPLRFGKRGVALAHLHRAALAAQGSSKWNTFSPLLRHADLTRSILRLALCRCPTAYD